jgi:transposase
MYRKPVDAKIRDLALQAVDAGRRHREIALQFGVSERWLRKVLRQRRFPTHRNPSTRFKLTDPNALRSLVAEHPDASLPQLSALLKDRHRIEMHPSSISRQMRKLKLRVKRKYKGCPGKLAPAECAGGARTIQGGDIAQQVQISNADSKTDAARGGAGKLQQGQVFPQLIPVSSAEVDRTDSIGSPVVVPSGLRLR